MSASPATHRNSQSGAFDLQINGYAGVDFNADDLTLDSVRAACERLQADGVSGVLATVITGSLEQMSGRLRRLVEIRQQDALVREMIVGFHIEGPFISPLPGFIGAHPKEHVRPADVEMTRRLLDAAGGLTRVVTLAPEHDESLRVVKLLDKEGVTVSAGHCDPSLETMRAAIDAGLSMFTHLGNGCPAELPRHDNIIQRVLSLSDRLWIGFIADGAHVPWMALGNYLRIVPLERVVMVSDATSAAGMGAGRFSLGGIDAVVGDDLIPRLASDPRYFAGSALTMPRAAENLRQHLGFDDRQIKQMCGVNPRRAIGIG